MRVLHLLAAGGIGGIETLVKNYAEHSQNENVFLFVYSGGIIADEIAKMGKEVLLVPMEIRGNCAKLRWILKCCKTLQVDVIVSHHSSPIFKIVLAWCSVFLNGVKTIAYAHANAADIIGVHYKGAFLRKLVHYIGFKAADGIVAISGNVKKSLENVFGLSKENIFVLYNAIRIPANLPPLKAFDEKLKLIYIGRLIEEKGVQTILKALSYFHLKDYVHLTIVGDGAYRENLEKLSVELGVNEAVEFVGMQKNVASFLRKADIFVHLPEWEEGFGITVVEAMAYGLLCICANNGALPELIADEENGFLVEAHSACALAEKLVWVRENAERYDSFEKIRKNAQSHACKFDIEKFTQELDTLLMLR